MKRTTYATLRKVLVTEKATAMAEADNTYVFAVHLDATKDDVKSAIQDIYHVTVEKVRTLIRRGKVKRSRVSFGKRSDVKKAYVTVSEGQKLPVYEEI